MKNSKITVKTKSKSYPIYFGNGIVNVTGKLIQKNLPNVKKLFVICDSNIPLNLVRKLKKSLKKYELQIYKLPAKEKTKNILIDRLSNYAGHTGIAGGQFLDLDFEKKNIPFKKIVNMQLKKTFFILERLEAKKLMRIDVKD